MDLASSSPKRCASGIGPGPTAVFPDGLGSHNRGECRKFLANAIEKRWGGEDPWWWILSKKSIDLSSNAATPAAGTYRPDHFTDRHTRNFPSYQTPLRHTRDFPNTRTFRDTGSTSPACEKDPQAKSSVEFRTFPSACQKDYLGDRQFLHHGRYSSS